MLHIVYHIFIMQWTLLHYCNRNPTYSLKDYSKFMGSCNRRDFVHFSPVILALWSGACHVLTALNAAVNAVVLNWEWTTVARWWLPPGVSYVAGVLNKMGSTWREHCRSVRRQKDTGSQQISVTRSIIERNEMEEGTKKEVRGCRKIPGPSYTGRRGSFAVIHNSLFQLLKRSRPLTTNRWTGEVSEDNK